MTLRPNDYDRSGDIIPDSVREETQGDNNEALFVLNHLFYNCDNMTQKEYDILRKAIMKGGADMRGEEK